MKKRNNEGLIANVFQDVQQLVQYTDTGLNSLSNIRILISLLTACLFSIYFIKGKWLMLETHWRVLF